jgi:hypothetical protein
LRNVLDSIPKQDRIDFLREVLTTLSESDKRTLLERAAPLTADPRHSSPHGPGAIEKPRVGPTMAAAPVLLPPIQSTPRESASPQGPKPEPPADESPDRQAQIEAEFKRLAAVGSRDRQIKQNMRRELIGCIALGTLALALLVVLAFGAGNFWQYLKSLF